MPTHKILTWKITNEMVNKWKCLDPDISKNIATDCTINSLQFFDVIDRKEAEREHNRRTMSKEQFWKWECEQQEEEWEDDDAYFSRGMDSQYQYSRDAPPEYANYCFQTSIQLDYGAKVLENQRLMNEWKKEKEEKNNL